MTQTCWNGTIFKALAKWWHSLSLSLLSVSSFVFLFFFQHISFLLFSFFQSLSFYFYLFNSSCCLCTNELICSLWLDLRSVTLLLISKSMSKEIIWHWRNFETFFFLSLSPPKVFFPFSNCTFLSCECLSGNLTVKASTIRIIFAELQFVCTKCSLHLF